MPAKGRRIASRQAQLGRKKRRAGRPGAEAATEPTRVAPAPEPMRDESAPETQAQARSGGSGAATAVAAPPRPRTTPQSRARAESPAAYSHVIPELRRIFIVAGVLVVVLIVLSFFL